LGKNYVVAAVIVVVVTMPAAPTTTIAGEFDVGVLKNENGYRL
jgi:hypothetical protein